MKTVVNGLFVAGLSAAAFCAAALPAAAAPWTQAGASEGVPAGALPPPGFYFVGAANWGNSDANSTGVAVQDFIWVPGWNFLGASYAAGVTAIEVEVGTHNTNYIRGVYNPEINPITLSWNLGNGFFASFGEFIYLPMNSEITFSSPGATSGASFEQHAALSYVTSEWIASVNVNAGITTADAIGNKQPDYLNVDLTLLKEFGKWRLGPVAYGSFDLQTTSANNPAFGGAGRGVALGVGGLVGYNFGPVDFSVMLTHQVDTHGDTSYGRDDTRVWTTITIPIWNPTAPAPKPLVAKY
jgi:hypothetical protein